YALYCGEPIFTAFLRTKPGPRFWTGFFVLLSLGMIVPGLAFHGAAVMAAFHLGRPPTEADKPLIMMLAYVCLALVVLPVLFGGKIYRMMLAVMTAKVFIVLGCTLLIGVLLVSPANWWQVFSGFLKFGDVPVAGPDGGEVTVNAFATYFTDGAWPVVS